MEKEKKERERERERENKGRRATLVLVPTVCRWTPQKRHTPSHRSKRIFFVVVVAVVVVSPPFSFHFCTRCAARSCFFLFWFWKGEKRRNPPVPQMRERSYTFTPRRERAPRQLKRVVRKGMRSKEGTARKGQCACAGCRESCTERTPKPHTPSPNQRSIPDLPLSPPTLSPTGLRGAGVVVFFCRFVCIFKLESHSLGRGACTHTRKAAAHTTLDNTFADFCIILLFVCLLLIRGTQVKVAADESSGGREKRE